MWVKRIVAGATAERSLPAGCIYEVDKDEGERLLAAGHAVPAEQPVEAAAVKSAEKAVSKRKAKAKKA